MSDSKVDSNVQGEGDYEAARRYRKGAEEFSQTHDTEGVARDAEPRTAEEARELERAQEEGMSRAKTERAARTSSSSRGE